MHDLSYFREHLDLFAEMAERRNVVLDLDGFAALDKERRELITANERRKASRNKASDEIARLKKDKQNADALIAEMKQVSEQIKQSDERIAELDAKQRDLMLIVPNVPHSSVPNGQSARTTSKSAAGVRRHPSIFSRSRTGKLASAQAFSICPPPPK